MHTETCVRGVCKGLEFCAHVFFTPTGQVKPVDFLQVYSALQSKHGDLDGTDAEAYDCPCAKTTMRTCASACQTALMEYKDEPVLRAKIGITTTVVSSILLSGIPLSILVAACTPPSPSNASQRSSKARLLLHSTGGKVVSHSWDQLVGRLLIGDRLLHKSRRPSEYRMSIGIEYGPQVYVERP